MKKNGKKWRKQQKEAETRKAIAALKAGEPYSKAKKRKKLCIHYGGRPGGIISGKCYSKLVLVGEDKCVCTECGKVFSAEQYKQMQALVFYMSNKGCVADLDFIAEISKGLEPVYYRRISENEVEILETLDNQIVMPRHTGVF